MQCLDCWGRVIELFCSVLNGGLLKTYETLIGIFYGPWGGVRHNEELDKFTSFFPSLIFKGKRQSSPRFSLYKPRECILIYWNSQVNPLLLEMVLGLVVRDILVQNEGNAVNGRPSFIMGLLRLSESSLAR